MGETKKPEKKQTITSLEDYLLERDYPNAIKTYTLTKGEQSFELKYRPLTVAEYGELRIKCRTTTPDGAIISDETRFMSEVIAKCCIEPNFNNTTFISKANCTTPVQFVSTMFAPLEIEIISNVILTNSGVDARTQIDNIEQIKNL